MTGKAEDHVQKQEEKHMEAGAITAVVAFGVMALIAVLAAVVSAIAAVSGFSKPEDSDE